MNILDSRKKSIHFYSTVEKVANSVQIGEPYFILWIIHALIEKLVAPHLHGKASCEIHPCILSISITPVNDVPVAQDQSVSTNKNTAVNITLIATDIDEDELTYTIVSNPTHGSLSGTAPNITYTPDTDYSGTDSFTFKVNDGTVDSNIATVSITVIETNEPPDCTQTQASPNRLWPPNHKMKDIQITGVTDPEGDPVEIEVTAIMQDEPTNGQGDGDKSPDATISPLQVRSERSGPANGRVYHITFTANDPQGEACSATVTVCVPHDNSDETCIDEGPLYDSTQP